MLTGRAASGTIIGEENGIGEPSSNYGIRL